MHSWREVHGKHDLENTVNEEKLKEGLEFFGLEKKKLKADMRSHFKKMSYKDKGNKVFPAFSVKRTKSHKSLNICQDWRKYSWTCLGDGQGTGDLSAFQSHGLWPMGLYLYLY